MAAAIPSFPRIIWLYISKVIVLVLVVYKIIDVDSSVIIIIQLRIAPEITPGMIIGVVMRRKVFVLLEPRLTAASSMLGGILRNIALEERTV